MNSLNEEGYSDNKLQINEDSFDQIDTKFEKEDIINKDVFFPSNKRIKKLGNMYTFLFDKNGSPLIAIGPHCI